MNSIAKFLGLVWLGSFLVTPSLFGQAGNDNPGGVTAEFYGSITTAGQYDPYTGNARREIDDIVVPGTVGAYPLKFTRTLSTRGVSSGNYDWGLAMYYPYFHPGSCGTDIRYCESLGRVSYPSGGSYDLEEPGPGEPWHLAANGRRGADDLLFDCTKAGSECTAGARFEIRRADGGKVLFEPGPYGFSQFRAYAILDPFGQRTTLTYYDTLGNGFTIWKVTEPGGRFLEFVYVDGEPYTIHGPYGDETQTPRLLATVRANDGQGNIMESVNYGYDWVQTGGFSGGHSYRLRNVYYAEGAVATYTYVTSNAYIPDGPGRSDPPTQIHSCDDPRYAGPMKYIEYEYVSHTEVADVARGQIKAEKNILGQRVSSTTYPPAYANPTNDPNYYRRTETRGDGPTRTIYYAYNPAPNAFGMAWTDFKNQLFGDATTGTGTGWTVTDPRNNTTTYEIEQVLGALKKITYPQTEPGPSPATKEYTFTNPLKPYYHSGEKDENGNWTTFDRDPVTHQVTQIHHPDGSTEVFTYNNLGQVLTHTLRSGGTESFEYDNRQDGIATRGLKTSYTPPATGSDPAPSPHPTRYTYYQASDGHPTWIDRLRSVTDPRQNTTWFYYNERGQVTTTVHQDGTYTQSAYNLDGTLAWSADENHPNAGLPGHENERTRYTYDQYKRVLTVTLPGETLPTTNYYGLDWANPLLHTTNSPKYTLTPLNKNVVYDYDANLRKIAQTVAANTPDVATTWFEYDEVGNLIKTTDPRGKETTFAYDQRNRKISMNDALATHRNPATGHTMDWKYDGVGNRTKEIRTDNAFRSWIYDVPNRTTYAIDWRMSLAEPALTTTTVRSATGRVETITDPKLSVYTLEFDELLRKTKETYPANVGNVNLFETWRYDVAGNLDRYTSRDGSIKQFASYDNRNRATSFSWSNEPAGRTTQGQSFQYDPASRVTALHNAEADISIQYDWANRKTSETETIKSYGLNQTHTVAYDYDDDGNRSQMVYPGGWDYRYSYTERGQLANIRLAWLSNPTVQYTYDSAGNRQRRTNYSGAYTDYVYNPLNQLSSQVSYLSGATPRFDYGFDTVNRIKYEQRDGGAADGFTYDPRSELTGFNQSGTLNGNGTVTANYNVAISYDNNGNRIDAFDGSNAHYVTKPNNQYESDWTGALGYDGNANLTSRAWWAYGYDAQNRLVSIDAGSTHIRYHYDPLNRMVAWDKNNTITTQVWDNWNLIEEHTGNDAFQRMYLHGAAANEPVVSYGPAWGDAYYWQDGRGNVTHLTDGSNNVKERYTYFVSGQPTYWTANTMNNRFLFEGAMYIPEGEIYDMRNRFYHPNLGRFMQSDPVGLQIDGEKLSAEAVAYFWAGKAPEKWSATELNTYRYCGNDPVDGSDPFGLAPLPVKDDVDQKSREGLGIVRDIMKKSGDGMERAKSTGRDKNTDKVFIGEPTEIGKWNSTRTGQSVEIPGPGRGVDPESGVHAHPDNHQTDGNGHVRTDGKPGPIASDKDRKWADVVQRPIYTISENGRMIERYRPDDSAKRNGGVTERWNGHSWDPLRY